MRAWGGLVLVALAACTPTVATVAPVVPRVTTAAPVAACATETEDDEKRAVFASARDSTVADARTVIEESATAKYINIPDETERAEAQRKAGEEQEQELAELAARAGRLELPAQIRAERLEGDARNGPGWFISSCVAFYAGGAIDDADGCTKQLFVRSGCAWVATKAHANGLVVSLLTTPKGERLFEGIILSEQCGRQMELYAIRDGNAVVVATFDEPSGSAVCGDYVQVDRAQEGPLTSVRISHRNDAGEYELFEELVWTGMAYEKVRPTRGGNAAAPPRSP